MFFAIAIDAWLSQCRETGGVGYSHNGMSANNSLNHSVSLFVNSKATNSNSLVELVVHHYLVSFQDIAPLVKVST